MMLDRVLATLSALVMIGFMSIVLVYVDEPALWIIVIIVLAMMVADFVITLRRAPKSPST
jgi:hypothetical protein